MLGTSCTDMKSSCRVLLYSEIPVSVPVLGYAKNWSWRPPWTVPKVVFRVTMGVKKWRKKLDLLIYDTKKLKKWDVKNSKCPSGPVHFKYYFYFLKIFKFSAELLNLSRVVKWTIAEGICCHGIRLKHQMFSYFTRILNSVSPIPILHPLNPTEIWSFFYIIYTL